MKPRTTTSTLLVGCAAVMLFMTAPVAANAPCSKCIGTGMFDPGQCPGGTDLIPTSTVELGIDMPEDGYDCNPDTHVVFSGGFTIERQAAAGGVIDAEITEMTLTAGDGTVLVAGAGLGQGGVLPPTLGTTTDNGDGTGYSSFDVFFEIDLGGGIYLYNHEPLVVGATIDCIPPDSAFVVLDPCIEVYDAPPGARNPQVVARVTDNWIEGPDLYLPHDPYRAGPKWEQFPDLSDTGLDVHASDAWPGPVVLADDFECTTTGPLTEIHVWGSWYMDMPPFFDPYAVDFQLSIHADIPAGTFWACVGGPNAGLPCETDADCPQGICDLDPTSHSRPGRILWMGSPEFTVNLYQDGLYEGWYNPATGEYEPFGDSQVWEYVFYLDECDTFIQQGTVDEPVVYWLDVQAVPHDWYHMFGWKTSLDHWNDDAVWGQGYDPPPAWFELIYPPDHPMFPESIDLAFSIYGEELYSKWLQLPHGPGEGFDEASDFWWDEGEPLKWEQLPNEGLSGLHCDDWLITEYGAITLADDFLCEGGDIIRVEWWGNYEAENPGSGLNRFELSLHGCAPGPQGWCVPAEPAFWVATVPFAAANETDSGLMNNMGETIYHYSYDLPDPYPQIPGEYYWLDIGARFNDPAVPAVWRWQEADRTSTILGHAPAAESTLQMPWQSIVWPPPPEDEYSDMAFRIISAGRDSRDPIIWDNYPSGHSSWVNSSQLDLVYPFDSQSADDFMFTENMLITDVHWRGRYWNQDPLVPNTTSFHILFYADDGTGNVPVGGPTDPSALALAHYNIPIGDITVTPNGDILDGYDYEVVLPPTAEYPDGFLAEAGVKYWIAIQSENIYQPQWGIMSSLDQQLHTAVYGFPLLDVNYWTDIDNEGVYPDLCFRLTGLPMAEVNKVVADDFQSDGRKIDLVHWWGSYLDYHYSPDYGPEEPYVIDGWFISFHHDQVENPGCPPDLMADPHPTAVGIYYCPVDAVEIIPAGYYDCFDHPVYEYKADLSCCCLICSEGDPRSGTYPAQPDAFYEETDFWYWLDIQAVVGVTWDPPLCDYDDRILTGHIPSDLTADGHFWGWHTSPDANRYAACTGEILDFSPYPPDCWDYGNWDVIPWSCPTGDDPVDMAFELLTSEEDGEECVPPEPERGYWGYANAPSCLAGVKYCHDLSGGGSGTPCTTDADCPAGEYCWDDCWGDWSAASCVVYDHDTGAARCYIPKNRYLTIDPTVNPGPVAYHVTLVDINDNNCTYPCPPDGHLVEGFLTEPVCRLADDGCTVDPAPNPACQGTYLADPGPPPVVRPLFGWVAYVVPGPVAPRTWTEYPVFVAGCETIPAATYEVRCSPDGFAPTDPPLILPTSHKPPGQTQFWGDVTSEPGVTIPWRPPEYAMNFADISAVIKTFIAGPGLATAGGGPPREWCDVEIDHVVSFSDISFLINAFQGVQYCSITDITGGCSTEPPRPLIGHDPCDCPPYIPPP